MIEGILGKKVGMTQRITEDGAVQPVTVIQAGPCHVMALRTQERDGYQAAQLGFEDKKRKNSKKPEVGHARKAKVEPKRFVREVRVLGEEDLELGATVAVGLLEGVEKVDIRGVSKGKGFQGVVKRYGFRGHPASHGSSKDHRRPGSIGASATPSRVFRGQRMPGRMGRRNCTVRNLKVVAIDTERNLLMVRGAVPGPNGGYVVIRRAIAQRQANQPSRSSGS